MEFAYITGDTVINVISKQRGHIIGHNVFYGTGDIAYTTTFGEHGGFFGEYIKPVRALLTEKSI